MKMYLIAASMFSRAAQDRNQHRRDDRGQFGKDPEECKVIREECKDNDQKEQHPRSIEEFEAAFLQFPALKQSFNIPAGIDCSTGKNDRCDEYLKQTEMIDEEVLAAEKK